MHRTTHALSVVGRELRWAGGTEVVAGAGGADEVLVALDRPRDLLGLELYLAFEGSGCAARVPWDGESAVPVPAECAARPQDRLRVGVEGWSGGRLRWHTARMEPGIPIVAAGPQLAPPRRDRPRPHGRAGLSPEAVEDIFEGGDGRPGGLTEREVRDIFDGRPCRRGRGGLTPGEVGDAFDGRGPQA